MRNVRAALIQAQANMSKQDAIDKHIKMIADAAGQGAQVVGLQEIFHGPYFCAEQDAKWYDTAEPEDGPDGQQDARGRARARHRAGRAVVRGGAARRLLQHRLRDRARTARIVGKYRKTHIPHVGPCFWEKFYFKPGNLGYPVFDTSVGRIGLIICYDRHFPEVARELGLKGAEIVFNPSATVESLSKYLWELEQPAHAVANGFWIGGKQPGGRRGAAEHGKFYGSSYFCSPRGKIIAQASDSEDEVLVADLDLDVIREVRNTWQFFRDRRPETYGELAAAAAMTTLIKNGTVVTATDMTRADVLIDGERIQAIGTGCRRRRTASSTRQAATSCRAASTCTPTWSCRSAARFASDDFATGTAAAAWGGTTTIVDFAVQDYGQSLSAGPGPLAGEGEPEIAHRLRPAPDRARDQRADPARDGRDDRPRGDLVQAVHGLPGRVHAGRRVDLPRDAAARRTTAA